ncbi:MAG: LysM peptidoglycan-binding domain-containing protein [Herbinix sp.]|nr:LysM peptidoglycan-binding domain-containing protein [Herbinix sp.]
MYCINYVIRKGDTLYSISRHFNVDLDAIMAANPMVNVYRLMEGEVLCIPVSVPSNNFQHSSPYMIEEGDTLGSVLERNRINLADLLEFTDLSKIFLVPGTTLQIPKVEENGQEIMQ